MDEGLRITDREDPAELNFPKSRPFTPTINFPKPMNSSMFYCRSNSTLLDSSYDNPHMSFFNASLLSPTASTHERNMTKGSNFLTFHQNQRSTASIRTAQSRADSATHVYKMSQFNRSSTSMLSKPPRFLSSKIMNLTSKLNCDSGTTTPIGRRSSSPKLNNLFKRYGNSAQNSVNQFDFEASSFID